MIELTADDFEIEIPKSPWPDAPDGFEWNFSSDFNRLPIINIIPNKEFKQAIEQWEVKNPLEDEDMDFIEQFLTRE